jgi:hypothetical protein
MRFLPDISGIWVDFLHSRLPLLPGSCEMHRMQTVVNAVRSRRTQNCGLGLASDAVVVATNFYVSLFGGPVSQILKCLTAIWFVRSWSAGFLPHPFADTPEPPRISPNGR